MSEPEHRAISYAAASPPAAGARSHITLALCAILHAFTHAYGVILVPLYLMMRTDLGLHGVKAAALVVTVYGMVYNLGSYGAGMLADRFDRRVLLAIGLLGNATAIAAMGIVREYEWLLVLGVLAGLFGTLYHPAAAALVTAHYPRNPGMAIGILGMGSGLGFFIGPQFAGWRAQDAAWHLGSISQWQKPCVELGVAGLLFSLIFVFIAREAHGRAHETRRPAMGRKLTGNMLALAAVLGWRDFAGTAVVSLASIYLQKACGMNVMRAGLIVGGMMLLGMFANPTAILLSPGKRRLPALVIVLTVSGLILMTTPYWPLSLVLAPLCGFQTLQLGSYALSDAATLERVDPALRGRVIGIYLMTAGTLGSMSPWIIGFWTDRLGERAMHPSGYVWIFATLGAMMWVAAFSPRCIRRLGMLKGEAMTLGEEIMPATMEAVM